MTSVAIVVLNWNGADDAIECMDSLLAQSLIPDIILVDNDSHDTSRKVLDSYIASHPRAAIHFIKNTENSGFAGGNNVGFNYALSKKYKYIGTLNPDATADKLWVASIVKQLESYPEAGIATGILARTDHTHVDTTGDTYTTWGIPTPRGRDGLLSEAPKDAEYIFGSTGGGFIARRSLFEQIGLFDEKFFMYYEDIDLCFRAQLAGFTVRYTPKAIAYHKLSASTNKVPGLAVYNTFKNLPMVFFKNVPYGLWWEILPRFFLSYLLILGNAVVHENGVPALKGFGMSLLYLPHSFQARRVIQDSRTVTNDYISSIILHDIPPEQTGLRKFRKLFTGIS